jgi:4-hydroxy-3-methylbut-2-enyl diphosphate reductase
MKIVRAERAGMCMGVNLALSKLDALIARMPQPGSLFILGSIIHNPQVVRAYAEKGVITVQSPAEIPAGATAVIRAHGVTKEVENELSQRGVLIVDATCPKVKAACLLIEKHTASGRILLLYGEATHPEVKCLLSYAAAGAFVFDSREACSSLLLDAAHSYCLAAQTTQDKAIFKEISTELKGRADLDLIVLDTICDATRERQDEAVRIAREVDFVVVAGGYESSNTRRLAQVVLAQGRPALHIETAADLPLAELKKFQRIGLTAGASTPKAIVDEIERVLETL